MTACRNSSRLVGWLTLVSLVRVTSDHKFSIGFISGDTAGHTMCSIPSVSLKLTTVEPGVVVLLSQNYAQMSNEQMAITFPPGSLGTGSDPGFHRRCEGHIFDHGGKHPKW